MNLDIQMLIETIAQKYNIELDFNSAHILTLESKDFFENKVNMV